MSRKPGHMYREIKQHAYTRREYMGGVPPSRITQFVIGNKSEKFPLHLSLAVNERCQIRHTALESARVAATRTMEKKTGITDFRITVHVYPHHVIRENKQATGAGADRVSQGMRASYGKPVGTAARVQKDQVLMTIDIGLDFFDHAKNALRKAGTKVPTPCKVTIDKGLDLLQ